ncbi:MAG: hypothetical protein ACI9EK_002371 [Psychroserpens sp.]|jgi:hypothetical protein
MKHLRKIIALFVFILFVGILFTLHTINYSLNNKETPRETVDIRKDTLFLLRTPDKTV